MGGAHGWEIYVFHYKTQQLMEWQIDPLLLTKPDESFRGQKVGLIKESRLLRKLAKTWLSSGARLLSATLIILMGDLPPQRPLLSC